MTDSAIQWELVHVVRSEKGDCLKSIMAIMLKSRTAIKR